MKQIIYKNYRIQILDQDVQAQIWFFQESQLYMEIMSEAMPSDMQELSLCPFSHENDV